MTKRLSPGLVLALLFSLSPARAASDRELSFAHREDLILPVGKFEVKHGWVQAQDFYNPPAPADFVTIFGLHGRLGVVQITSPRRANPNETPSDWSATVSTWNWHDQTQGLAITGVWPDIEIKPQTVALDDVLARSTVSTYLRSKGLEVPTPQVTEAFTIDLDGDGAPEQLYVAHSDDHALADNAAGNIYAVALLVKNHKTIPLESQCRVKPAHRTKAQDEALYGVRDYLRFVTFIDLNDDGRKEIVIYDAKKDATQVDVFSLDGARVRKVLSAFRRLIF
jgi:hypothetical protein